MNSKKIVLTGANGQLGMTLQRLWAGSELNNDYDLVSLDLQEIDIADRDSIDHALSSLAVDTIINVAAYTAVDKAEAESQLAYSVNAQGAKNLD